MRLGAVTGARWDEISFDHATWTVPGKRMKRRGAAVGEPHVVPLSKQAMALLNDLKAHRSGPFVFFGQDMRHPISDRAVQDQCERVTARSASPHGWRSTFRTWCGEHGVDREVAEAAIAHKVKGVEGRYQRGTMIGLRRPVMQDWADFCDGKSADNVVALGRRA
jgi:integrase